MFFSRDRPVGISCIPPLPSPWRAPQSAAWSGGRAECLGYGWSRSGEGGKGRKAGHSKGVAVGVEEEGVKRNLVWKRTERLRIVVQ